MMTIVGASTLFYFDELAVAQNATMENSKVVQTLVVVFDQAAYEAYPSGHGRPRATWHQGMGIRMQPH